MKGFLPYLLMTNKQVFGGIAPSTKLTPPGYLKMLLANTTPNVVSKGKADGSGHIRDVKIKYRPRVATGKSSTSDDCSIQAKPVYLESEIAALNFRKYGIFLEYNTIAQYEKEASETVALGRPAPPQGILMEIYNAVIEAANGLFGDINNDLLTAQAAAFGKNVTTGLATSKAINFPLSTANNPLDQGLTMLMDDIMQNEINLNNTVIVGSGLINNVYLQKSLGLTHTNQANTNLNLPGFFFDPYAAAKFGANKFGVFEKNAVQLININQFDGFIGGDKMSTFMFTLQLPVVDSLGGTQLQSFKFDAQLRHIDCPSEVQIGGEVDGEGNPVLTSVGRGWVLDIMANYGQFNIQSDAYSADDRLTGNNGTLLYTAANT